MKSKKILKLAAMAALLSTGTGLAAGPVNAYAAVKRSTGTAIYLNDFSKNTKPAEVNGKINKNDISIEEVTGDKALQVESKFDGSDNWESNKHEFAFLVDSDKEMGENSTLEFDIIIPESQAGFTGNIRYQAGLSAKDWGWKGSTAGKIASTEFKSNGKGFLKSTVSVTIPEKCDGLRKITLQISAENCNYSGKFYLDNIKLSADAKNDNTEWDVEKLQVIDFSMKEHMPSKVEGGISKDDVSIDEVNGNKALKVNTKFDGTNDSWKNKHELAFNIDSENVIEAGSAVRFDVIIPESQADFDGTIRYSAGISDKNWGWIGADYANLTSADFESDGNGYLKATLEVPFKSEINGLKAVTLQLLGQQCEYKGEMFIDNVELVSLNEIDRPEGLEWTFDTSTQGWKYEGNWAYSGTEEVGFAKDLQALRLGVDYSKEVENSWSEFKVKTEFAKPANLLDYNQFSFDFIYNPENMTTGGFKAKLFIPDGPSKDVEINLDNAEDLGNGLKKAKVVINFDPADVNAQSATLGIIGYCTDYKGNIYLDNIKISKVENITEKVKWTFDESLEGWKYGGSWAYNGTEEVDHSKDLQAVRLGVDYTNDVESSWSEFKIDTWLDEPVNIAGCNFLKFDFIFNPENMTIGGFKAKLFIPDGPDAYTDINLDNAEDLGNGLKKAKVTIEFNEAAIDVQSITLGIIGANTDYKGDLFVDNIAIGAVETEDIYVTKVQIPTEQKVVNIKDLTAYMPSEVTLADDKATESTADLYAYLMAMGKTENVIYGHQNDTHHKASYSGGTNSDTKDITGSISGITGIDTLSFSGDELKLTDEEIAQGLTYVKKSAQIGAAAYKEGAITTLSAHMPNFDLVAAKGKNAEGKYDFSGYSPNITKGDIVSRIMPGGDLNEVFTQYLDLIAEYAHNMVDDNGNEIPVLFRPFHENNGSWFWWGAAFCDAQAYKNLFAYTVDYLKNDKDVHNFLYVYSPNGPFENEDDYLSRYPGDEYIDVIAFDMYHDNPEENAETDPWMASFKETIELVQKIADEKGKLSAVSETGIRINGGGMPVKGNPNKNWFKDVSDIISDSNMPYYMVWANFNTTDNFFAPFMVDETKGHEMINEFVDFYNDDKTIFANGIGNYTDASTKITANKATGYITSPISRNRILDPVKITGVVRNTSSDITFEIKNKDGKVIEILKAVNENGKVSADLTKEILDKIGETTGTIELKDGDTVLNKINAIFNIPEREYDPLLVDDFEGHFGDNALLTGDWATNVGPGCKVTPVLSDTYKNSGDYGLGFNYTISTTKVNEGWAGVTKMLKTDWTGMDALQIWVKPDGKGQKLVIQITSNGEDFEVRMPEFAATTEPQLLVIPFSEFKGKNGGTLDLAKIEKMGIWCNTLVPEGVDKNSWTVTSSMYFDDIKAVKNS